MGIINWLKGSDKTEERRDFAKAMVISSASKSQSETEFDRGLAEKGLLVIDQGIEDMQDADCYEYGVMPSSDGKTFTVEKTRVDHNGQARRLLNSSFLSLGNITQEQADIEKKRASSILMTIMMDMNEDSYELGVGNKLNAEELHVHHRIQDSVDGRKAQQLTERKIINQMEAKIN